MYCMRTSRFPISQYAFAAGSAFLSMDWCATGSNNIKLIFVAVALRTPWPKASGVGKLAAKWPRTVCFQSTHKGIFGSSRWQQSESGQKGEAVSSFNSRLASCMICHLICGKKLVCAKFGRFSLHHLLHQRVHIDGDRRVVVWILQTKQKIA